jgi:hypothetical protein
VVLGVSILIQKGVTNMATFTFRETATIYTTVVADTEEQAWLELDKVGVVIPDNMAVDVHDCEIHEMGEE